MDSNQAHMQDGIGKRIAAYRKNAGFSTASEFAAEIVNPKITAATIANIESGRRAYVSVAELFEIAFALKVSPLLLMVDYFKPSATPEIKGLGIETGYLTNKEISDWVTLKSAPYEADTNSSYSVDELTKALDQLNARRSSADVIEFTIWVVEDPIPGDPEPFVRDEERLKELRYELQVHLYALEGAYLKLKQASNLVDISWFDEGVFRKIDRDFDFIRPELKRNEDD